MFETSGFAAVLRNVGVYLVGVALAVVGALGLSSAFELSFVASTFLFVVGLAAVIAVHEYLGGLV